MWHCVLCRWFCSQDTPHSSKNPTANNTATAPPNIPQANTAPTADFQPNNPPQDIRLDTIFFSRFNQAFFNPNMYLLPLSIVFCSFLSGLFFLLRHIFCATLFCARVCAFSPPLCLFFRLVFAAWFLLLLFVRDLDYFAFFECFCLIWFQTSFCAESSQGFLQSLLEFAFVTAEATDS